MSVSYFVRYEVEAPADFLRHYREKHVPILARWPGLRRVVDFQRFMTFEGTVTHQAMNSEEVVP
jgi:hypothetical protein